MSFFKKAKRTGLKIGATVRHKARKTPLVHYAPAFGSGERSIVGTKLSKAERKHVLTAKARSARKTKKQARRIWRKLI